MSAGTGDGTDLETAVVSVLAAVHALAHRLALAEEDEAALERHRSGLDPSAWRRTTDLLREADWTDADTGLDAGLLELALRWLGFAGEGAFEDAFGCRLAEALKGCRGRLAALAHAVETRQGARSEADRYRVTVAWSRRATLLMEGLPGTAPAAVQALERGLAYCPASHELRANLHEALAVASEACGDVVRAERARGRLVGTAVERELGGAMAPALAGSALVLSVLFAIADGKLLLVSEHGLDPGIAPWPETWERVRRAVRSGRIASVPIPVRTFGAWTATEGGTEEALRACLEASAERLAELVRVVERLWGRTPPDEEAALGLAYWVQTAACRRWAALRAGYQPLPGERGGIWLEAHQGAERPETLERVGVVRRVREVFRRAVGVQPSSLAEVYLDRADEAEALGRHDEALGEIESALEVARGGSHDPVWWRPAEVRLARWLLASGSAGEAREILARLPGPDTSELLAAIDRKAAEREALKGAERAWRRSPGVETGLHLALSYLEADHPIAAERVAAEVCRRLPDEALAWATQAWVLEAAGRYRDARAAMAAALERGFHESVGRAFDERMSARRPSG